MGTRPLGVLRQRSGKVSKRTIKVVAVLAQHAPDHQQVHRHLWVEWADDGICITDEAGITTGLRGIKVSLG